MKKTFIITELGTPFDWTQKYIDNATNLGKYGWYWKIFTPNKYESTDNVEIVPMTAEQLADLTFDKLGVKPNLFITPKGFPSVHVTDFYVFIGKIFEDYLKDTDFWGITNMDIVYGRLDHFITDKMLEDVDVWTDDVGPEGGRVNGIFSLWKNSDFVNRLCFFDNWQATFKQRVCPKCIGDGANHTLLGTDEIYMCKILHGLEEEGKIRYGYPRYYPLHSYDRLLQHYPDVNLEFQDDGSLWEKFPDMVHPDGLGMFKGYMAKEIPYFHFIRTKEWPKCL